MQAAHAAVEHAYQHGRPSDHHPSLIHITTCDKQQLQKLQCELINAGIITAEFHEPYQNWGLTAISCLLTEEQRFHLRDLQLWRLPTQE